MLLTNKWSKRDATFSNARTDARDQIAAIGLVVTECFPGLIGGRMRRDGDVISVIVCDLLRELAERRRDAGEIDCSE